MSPSRSKPQEEVLQLLGNRKEKKTTEMQHHVCRLPFCRASKEHMKVKMHPSAEESERQADLFLVRVVIHVFQQTAAVDKLSDQEKVFHVSRLVTQTIIGLMVVEGHVPHITEAKSMATNVIKELQETFGDTLKYKLLEQSPVESVIVPCLQRHAEKMFQKSRDHPQEVHCRALYLGVLFAFVFLSFISMGL
ncbi:hypothetical protein JOB18_011778 [Solea senegalensis]|uniref:Uncharacterized protein n=1 Tax=Solea senegalensis TaxID=28829 RepID=A0AAV6PLA4_SOLSE|nr:hypothetical protein JOB18_011778 [Solea senegalensis]